jgi:two-component system, OmpR family, alkaline phosphatase synthesis response regulator PhoP
MKQKKTYKALIVDDDVAILDLYSKKLSKEHFEVETGKRGDTALLKLREGFIPDVMIVDILMPVMNGVEFIKQVQREDLAPDAKIIVLSNQERTEANAAQTMNIKIDDYIVKVQQTPDEIVKRIKLLLET